MCCCDSDSDASRDGDAVMEKVSVRLAVHVWLISGVKELLLVLIKVRLTVEEGESVSLEDVEADHVAVTSSVLESLILDDTERENVTSSLIEWDGVVDLVRESSEDNDVDVETVTDAD